MTLQQLRSIQEVVRRGLNISAAARAMNNTPPNVSRYIRMLESELSVRIFLRAGGKLTGITPEGVSIIEMIEAVLDKSDSLLRLAKVMQDSGQGELTLGGTDVFATHVLPAVIEEFRHRYPAVMVNLLRGSSQEMARLAADGQIDFALVTEDEWRHGDLISLPCARNELSILLPQGHPLANEGTLSLEMMAGYPVATYVRGHAARNCVDEAFAAEGMVPDVVFSANDADLIKGHVRSAETIGIICASGYSQEYDMDLFLREDDGLFAPVMSFICIRRDSMLRSYGYDFIEMLAPHLRYERIAEVMTLRDQAQIDELLSLPSVSLPRRHENVAELPPPSCRIKASAAYSVRGNVASL